MLRSDRGLLVFPLLSSLCALLVAATFFAPLAFGGAVAQFHQDGQAPVWLWPLAFLFYLCQYFVIFFFNAALVGAARIRLDGGNPTLADGFRIASSHWQAILGYAALAATVGLILRAIEERAGFIGRWIVGLLGVAWTVATFLTVPVLVNESLGPIDAVKRSADLLKRTWGENLVGNAGLGVVFSVVIFAWMLLCAGLVALSALAGSTLMSAGVIGLGVIGVLLLGLLQNALQGVYAAALHRYAETGDAGFGFEGALVSQAFTVNA
ncbi:MAG TPA: DUF6159 family protein [Dokdonella sp.]